MGGPSGIVAGDGGSRDGDQCTVGVDVDALWRGSGVDVDGGIGGAGVVFEHDLFHAPEVAAVDVERAGTEVVGAGRAGAAIIASPGKGGLGNAEE